MRSFIVCILLMCACVFASESMFGNSSNGRNVMFDDGPSMRGAASLSPAFAEMAVDSNYVLGPGDFLDLMLEDKYLSVQIYPDGRVAVEECGSVVVGGKTIAEAREKVYGEVRKVDCDNLFYRNDIAHCAFE